MSGLSRRDLLKTGAIGAAAGAASFQAFDHAAAQEAPEQRPASPPDARGAAAGRADEAPLFFFNSEEAKWVTAAIDRLIPADDWPGAKEADVLTYIDQQLAGAYGVGARIYLAGPWVPDAPPQQGYQLRYAPAQLYRVGIAEARDWTEAEYGDRDLWNLPPEIVEEVLSAIEQGKAEFPSLPSATFFELLLANTIEGWFADPVYGGNKDMVSWRMIGFPGAFGQYVELVDNYDYAYQRPPMSIAGAPHLHSPADGE